MTSKKFTKVTQSKEIEADKDQAGRKDKGPFSKNFQTSFHNWGSFEPGISTWWNLWSCLAILAFRFGSCISSMKNVIQNKTKLQNVPSKHEMQRTTPT